MLVKQDRASASPNRGPYWKSKRVNVLLIEDNPRSAALALEMIQCTMLDVKIGVAMDEKKAVGYFNSKQERPDFIIMDLKQPGEGGLKILRTIRTKDKKVKVIILTDSPVHEDRKIADELGVMAYLPKPMSIAEMNRITFLLKEILLSL